MVALIVAVLACLLAAVAAADRLLALLAARLVARRIVASAGTMPVPLVRIGGVPFVTQLAAGCWRDVRVSFPAFTAGSMDIDGLDVRLTQVRARLARRAACVPPVAGRVTGTMTISLRAITGRLPQGLTVACRDGELRVAGSFLRMPVSGMVRVVAEPRRICVTPRVLGVPSLVGFVLAVPALPPEMVIGSVLVTDRGLAVSMHGANVSLAGGRETPGGGPAERLKCASS